MRSSQMNKHKPNWVLNDARKRMALFPQDADIYPLPGMPLVAHANTVANTLHSLPLLSAGLWVPVVVAGKNTKIWILPGV